MIAADTSLIRSRRGRVAAGAVAVATQSTARSITAAQVAERIRANVGTAWRDKTIDGFKAGSPETTVTGVVTTVMATRRVLARAVELGRNFVVTQEPVFYNANDEPGNRASDAVYLAKKAYIEQHGLVVFRFADHWNGRQPDPRVAALARTLSWDGPGTNGVFAIRETTLSALAAHLRDRLQIRGGLRTLGAPDMRVRSALLMPGTADVPTMLARLKEADVVVAGEPREWEVVPYLLDSRDGRREQGAALGGPRGLGGTGHEGLCGMAQDVRSRSAGRCGPGGRSLLEPARMTAQEIVTRIRQRLADQGITWRTETVDTFKAGIRTTAVSGIATTGMATFDVLRRAAKAGRNFVITHEPTFYNHQDQTAAFEQDPTYQAKQRFIREQNLVVWRFHDHAHAIRPDPLVVGSARMLGWASFASPTRTAHLRRAARPHCGSSPATSPRA